MFRYVQDYWAPQNLQGIALTQDKVGAGNLNLNGTYSVPTNTTVDLFTKGFISTVSLTSTNDLSAASFVISGQQNNTIVTETLVGPNNSTVETVQTFDIISSVSVSVSVTGISVGTGVTGFFPFYYIPATGADSFALSSSFSPYALSFVTTSTDGVTYEIFQSLGDLRNNGQTYEALILNGYLTPKGGPHINVSQILQFTDVCSNVLVKVTPTDETSTLYTQFLQL